VTVFGRSGSSKIVDDDCPGALSFAEEYLSVKQADEIARIRVNRTGGTSGEISARWRTVDGTAKAGAVFDSAEGNISLAHGDAGTVISVPLKPAAVMDENQGFSIEPLCVRVAPSRWGVMCLGGKFRSSHRYCPSENSAAHPRPSLQSSNQTAPERP